jgi:hypothetical protein
MVQRSPSGTHRLPHVRNSDITPGYDFLTNSVDKMIEAVSCYSRFEILWRKIEGWGAAGDGTHREAAFQEQLCNCFVPRH